jgi:hypothetical protein
MSFKSSPKSWFLATKSVSQLSSTMAARTPLPAFCFENPLERTLTPINPSPAVLSWTFSFFFAPLAMRSFSSHSRAASTSLLVAVKASLAFESETSVRLRSSATSFMLALVKEGEEEEKERKAWPATCGTRRGDRRGIIAIHGAYARGSVRLSSRELTDQWEPDYFEEGSTCHHL